MCEYCVAFEYLKTRCTTLRQTHCGPMHVCVPRTLKLIEECIKIFQSHVSSRLTSMNVCYTIKTSCTLLITIFHCVHPKINWIHRVWCGHMGEWETGNEKMLKNICVRGCGGLTSIESCFTSGSNKSTNCCYSHMPLSTRIKMTIDNRIYTPFGRYLCVCFVYVDCVRVCLCICSRAARKKKDGHRNGMDVCERDIKPINEQWHNFCMSNDLNEHFSNEKK